jgi:cyclophilin family peptidyl-prolyl cis-trans isomerase
MNVQTSHRALLTSVITLIVGGLSYTACTLKNKTSETQPQAQVAASQTAEQPSSSASSSKINLEVDPHGLSATKVVIKTTKGVIKYKFYSKDAPRHVARIVELIQKGFYNGLSFHRVEPGFVIQGGDPNGNGTGGSGQKLKAEFNARHHIEGTVAMARAQDPDSGDSQFYICLAPAPFLDNNYTVFGQVVEGMDIVHKISVGDKMESVSLE